MKISIKCTQFFWQKCKLKLKKSYLFFGKSLDTFH